ncbi:MAG: DMT family transporter [Anaerolineales bacterium]|nr:DMT family transporter [Anaerolineales bacterium]
MQLGPKLSPWKSTQAQGIAAALLSAFVSGLVPIFGKQAYEAGLAPFTVVMLRTVGAAAGLWLAHLLFWRKFVYIYPFALAACLMAGLVNGLGSLLFYTSLQKLDASLSQLLFTLYLLFLTLFSWLDGYRISRLTLLRVGLALAAVFLLKWAGSGAADWPAALMMIGAGAMYALHVSINQRTLYDVPAPTVTLYTLTGMAATVLTAYLLGGRPPLPASGAAWTPVLLLTAVTLIARLTLFLGVKHLGGMQAVLINLGEALVTVVAAILVLGETFTSVQWLGAAVLAGSLLLVTREQALGAIPRPKPWLPIFTQWFATLAALLNPPPAPPHPPPAPLAPVPSASDRGTGERGAPAPPAPREE